MNIPSWLLHLLPLWDYICPRCERGVDKEASECAACGELFESPLRVPPAALKNRQALERYVHEKVFPQLTDAQRDRLAQHFTEFFNDGFEDGDFSAWTGVSAGGQAVPTVQDVVKHTGTYAAKFHYNQETWCFAYQTLGSQYSTIYTRYYIRKGILPTTLGTRVMMLRSGNRSIISLMYELVGTYRFRLYNEADASNVGTYDITLTMDEWYCLEVKLVVHPTAGECRFYLDGTERIAGTSLDTSTYDFDKLYIGNDGEQSEDVYCDCCIIADAYIGLEDGQIVTLAGSSAGQSGADGATKLSMKVSGSIPGLSGASGPLKLTMEVIGSAAGLGGADASLKATKELIGSLGGEAGVLGSLTITGAVITLRGSSAGQSGTAGALELTMELVGSIAGGSGTSSVIKVTRTIAGTSDAQSTAAAVLKAVREILGSVAAESGAAGTLKLTMVIAGSLDAVSSLSGDLTVAFVLVRTEVDLAVNIATAVAFDGPLHRSLAIDGPITRLKELEVEV